MNAVAEDVLSGPGFASATRQRADVMFSSDIPVGGSDTFPSSAAEAAGYGAVAFFALSDRPFRIRAEQSCSPDGPWLPTDTFVSTFDMVSLLFAVCVRTAPCGTFMRIFLDNLAAVPQGILQLCVLGLPEAEAP